MTESRFSAPVVPQMGEPKTVEEHADEIARQVMESYGLKGNKIRQAVADAAQIGLESTKQEPVPSAVQALIEVHDAICEIIRSQYTKGRTDAAFGANQARAIAAERIITESKGTIRMNPTGGIAS